MFFEMVLPTMSSFVRKCSQMFLKSSVSEQSTSTYVTEVLVTFTWFLRHHPQTFPKMTFQSSLSLEETNKIRISHGLKPLTDDKAPVLNSEQIAENNYAKQREQEAKELETKCVNKFFLQFCLSHWCNSVCFPFLRRIKERIAK